MKVLDTKKIPILLGLGSNKSYEGAGPKDLIFFAIKEIKKVLCDIKTSSLWETEALYVRDQPNFFNAVLLGYGEVTNDIDSEIDKNAYCHDLLKRFQAIEKKFGRDRENEFRNGPRSLDIDIEAVGDYLIDTVDLIIPHPLIAERAFVLSPLKELLEDILATRLPYASYDKDKINKSLFFIDERLKSLGECGVKKVCSMGVL